MKWGFKMKKTLSVFVVTLLCLLSLNATAQDMTKHDPLLDPKTGGYPVFANSVEIVSITDSVRGLSDQVPSQRIFDLTADGQIAERLALRTGLRIIRY